MIRPRLVTLYLGDAHDVLAAMPDRCVDCIVTSPPYWGLRDYGTGTWYGGDPACPHRRPRAGDAGAACARCGAAWLDPQYGLEPRVEDYIARLVAVFDQARRVLATTGTLWLNLGDSYSTAAGGAPASGRPQRDGVRTVRPRTQDLLPPILWNRRSSNCVALCQGWTCPKRESGAVLKPAGICIGPQPSVRQPVVTIHWASDVGLGYPLAGDRSLLQAVVKVGRFDVDAGLSDEALGVGVELTTGSLKVNEVPGLYRAIRRGSPCQPVGIGSD